MNTADVAREFARAAASLIPVAGGPIQVLFENIFASPLEKRKREWLEQMAEAIQDLQQRVSDITPESLAANEVFITVALSAFPMAIRNHQKEKLDALRNAVLNSALTDTLDENEQLIFLRLVDHLTPWHLRFLFLLQHPRDWMARNCIPTPSWSMASIATVVEHCFPDLVGRQDVYEQIIRDLQTEGLVQQGKIAFTMMTAAGAMETRTTPLGDRFAKFISAPSM